MSAISNRKNIHDPKSTKPPLDSSARLPASHRNHLGKVHGKSEERYNITAHCRTLLHIAAHYCTLPHITAHCRTLLHIAAHCRTLPHIAARTCTITAPPLHKQSQGCSCF